MGNSKRLDPENEPAPGDSLIVEYRPQLTRCRRKCGGKRSNTESPAKLVPIWRNQEMKRVLVCTCCEQALVSELGKPQGAPAIDPTKIEGKHARFHCPDCGYNVVLLAELKPAK